MDSTSDITNNTAECFFLSENETRTAGVSADMLREMKNYSPGSLVLYCIFNMSLALLAFLGNALVVMTVATFSELRIVSNIGLASLATGNLFHGSIIHSLLFSVGVNVLIDGCPIFQGTTRFVAVFYLSHVFVYCSVFNLCIVTAERYIGVVFCLRYYAILPKERFVKLVAAAWLVSFLLSIPYAIDNSAFQTVGKVIMILTFSFVLAFLIYCNIRMFFISRGHKKQVNTQAQAVQQNAVENQRRFRGAVTVFYILLTVITCYVPFIVTRIVKAFADEDTLGTLVLVIPWTTSFYMMYCGISPFVYFFRRRELRRYSKKLLCKVIHFTTCDNNFS